MQKRALFIVIILLNLILIASAGNIIVQDGHLESTGVSNNYFKGEVGIGTDNPEIKLHINGTDGAAKGIVLEKDEGDRLYAYSGGSGPTGYFKIDTYKPTAPDAGRRLPIVLQAAGGNVGIGTASPSSKLHIEENAGGGGVITLLKLDPNSGTDGDGSAIDFVTSTDPTAIGARIAGIRVAAGAVGELAFYTGRDTWPSFESMRIDQNGNVGIGTTSPGGKLDIQTSSLGIYKGLNIKQSKNDANTYYGLYSTAEGITTTNIGGYFSATGATNNYGLIVENGNVGIGTTSPGAGLEIDTSGSTSGFKIENGDASDTWFNYQNANNNYIRGGTTFVDTTLDMNNHNLIDVNWAGSDDGSGSGLDADLLDGLHANEFTTGNEVTGLGIVTFNQAGTTTLDFISKLESLGAFNNYHSIMKASWSYASNTNIKDTGYGSLELAGCVVETWTDNANDVTRGNIHVRVTRPTTGSGGGQILVYNDQGSGYSPGWRQIWTSNTDGSGSGLDADLLDGQSGAYYAKLSETEVETFIANDVGTGYIPRDNGNKFENSPIYTTSSTGNVGIGTTTPAATLEVQGTVKIFGDWTPLNPESAPIQATTDGFFIGLVSQPWISDAGVRIYGYSDNNPNPTTLRGSASVWSSRDNIQSHILDNSFTIPVKKGAYYRASHVYQERLSTRSTPLAGQTITYYWIPLGG